MAKPIRFTPKKTAHGWRLNIPPKLSETGKRQQLFFRTQQLAKAAADDMKAKLETHGIQARAIAPTLAEQATAAAALLEPYGLTVLEAARMVAEMRKRDTASRLLGVAAADWLIACEGLRAKTLSGYKHTARRLTDALGDRLLSTLTAEDLQAVIAPPGTPQPTAKSRFAIGKAFWRWSASKGWCAAELFDKIELPRTSGNAAEIELLTPAEAERLLRTAETHFPQAVTSYALQLFAGIRAEELVRLQASHVSPEGIELSAEVTKKGRRRHITPSPTLRAWLERYPFAPCPNWKRVDRACRYLAGWDLTPEPDLVRPDQITPPGDNRPAWPQNALRHTHASYAVAAGASIETLLFEFGHTGTTAVLRAHYAGRASKRDAVAFFKIAPQGDMVQTLELLA